LGITVEQLSGDLKNSDFGAIQQSMKLNADNIAKDTREKIVSILEVCALGGQEKMAIELVRSGKSVDDARKEILEAKAKTSSQSAIRSTVTATGTGEVSPLIADAKQRAATAKK